MDPFDSDGCCHRPSVPFWIAGGRCRLRVRRVAVSGEPGRGGRNTAGSSFFFAVLRGAAAALEGVDGLTVPLPLTSSTKDLKRDLVGSAGSGEVTRLRVRNPFSPRPVAVGGIEPLVLLVVVVVAVGIVTVGIRREV